MNKPRRNIIMGVDPGLSGAIAYYVPAQDRIFAEDMPVADGHVDAASLARSIRDFAPEVALVEQVGSMPGQGVASTFKFGRSYGVVLGVITALGIPLHLVTPSKWKRHFRLSANKEQSRAYALRMWPTRADLFGMKKHDGRAEAALLALYANAHSM